MDSKSDELAQSNQNLRLVRPRPDQALYDLKPYRDQIGDVVDEKSGYDLKPSIGLQKALFYDHPK